MKATLAQLQDRYAQLSFRERGMVLIGGGALLVTLLYLLIWEPLSQAHARRAEDLQQARALATRIEALAAQTRGAAGGAQPNLSLSILSAVDQSARLHFSRPPSRIQPEGEREVKVWVDNASFEAALRWIQELEQRYGIRAQTAELERGNAPGVVNLQLSLVRS